MRVPHKKFRSLFFCITLCIISSSDTKEDNNSVDNSADEFKIKIHKQKEASTSKNKFNLIIPELAAVLD